MLCPPTEGGYRVFFGKNDNVQLTFEQFSSFVTALQREALVMQFNQWDGRGQGLLTATDFAKFLVTKVSRGAMVCFLESESSCRCPSVP